MADRAIFNSNEYGQLEYGEAVTIFGPRYRKCNRCGEIVTVNKPIIGIGLLHICDDPDDYCDYDYDYVYGYGYGYGSGSGSDY